MLARAQSKGRPTRTALNCRWTGNWILLRLAVQLGAFGEQRLKVLIGHVERGAKMMDRFIDLGDEVFGGLDDCFTELR